MKIIEKQFMQNIKKSAVLFILPLMFFNIASAANSTNSVNKQPQIDPQSKIQDPNIFS
ncbi:Tetratricopeptide repeat-containing protein [Rickettsia canadensis str. McKiel]|uniref:Tetratricopeptide repeat-containing protein n=1 Tax=Rickettsia canadensis (strain McKiel) TaxID=293613 RepID=A8EYP6_RICCK|nr:hypothetical protein [Rickettsia canadensis]ABV73479.1 Tetratricopeptide repeat-containing protein [Rickettsia canadensis str. McKiel]